MSKCVGCEKEAPQYCNWCSWDCNVATHIREGGKVHTPNGLPIGCICVDGNLYEIEHGDHPDYKFPVKIEYIGKEDIPESERWETHALIWFDDCVALTLYECCYFMWNRSTGDQILTGIPSIPFIPQWRLADTSLRGPNEVD